MASDSETITLRKHINDCIQEMAKFLRPMVGMVRELAEEDPARSKVLYTHLAEFLAGFRKFQTVITGHAEDPDHWIDQLKGLEMAYEEQERMEFEDKEEPTEEIVDELEMMD